jgi:hypothetical protein
MEHDMGGFLLRFQEPVLKAADKKLVGAANGQSHVVLRRLEATGTRTMTEVSREQVDSDAHSQPFFALPRNN